MKLKAEYKIGKQSSTEWSGVYGYKPEEAELLHLGEMYAVLRVATESVDFELERLAKLLIEELQKSYYESSKDFDSIINLLEDATWKMKSRMEIIMSREEELKDIGLDIELSVVIVKDTFLYGVVLGESKVFIWRDGNFVEISDAFVDLKMSGLIKSGSLKINQDDRIALSTSKGYKVFKDDLSSALETLDPTLFRKAQFESGASVMILADETMDWKELVEEIVVEEDSHGNPVQEEVLEEGQELEVLGGVGEVESSQFTVDSEENVEGQEKFEEDSHGNPDQEEAEGEDINQDSQDEVEKTDVKFSEIIEEERQEEIDALPKKSFVETLKAKALAISSGVKTKALDIKNNFGKPKEEDLTITDDDLNQTALERAKKLLNKSKDKAVGGVSKVKNHFAENQTTYVQIIKNFKSYVLAFVNKIVSFFKAEIIGSGGSRRLDHNKRLKRNRWLFGIAVVVVLYLLFNGVSGWNNQQEKQRIAKENAEIIAGLEDQYDDVVTQIDTNPNADNSRKSQILNSISSLEAKLEQASLNKDLAIKIDSLKSQLQLKKDGFLGISAFTAPQVIADFTEKYTKVTLSDMAFSQDFIFISDSLRNVIYRVRSELNSLPEEFILNLKAPQLLTVNESGEIVFHDENTTSSIGKFNPNNASSLKRFNGLAPAVVGKIDAFSIYSGNGALYEIHSNNNQIFKRERVGDQFAGGGAAASTTTSNWKTAGDLANAIDIKTPIDLYVLVKNKGLQRYFAGGNNNLTKDKFRGITDEDYTKLKKASAFDVSDRYVVIGDPVEQRLMIFEIKKTENIESYYLQLVKQVKYRGEENILTEISSIQLNQAASHIYVVDNGKLLRFSLQQ